MLTVSHKDIQRILQDFGIRSAIKCVTELQRCDYEHGDYSRKEEIRFIVKVELISGPPVVIRPQKWNFNPPPANINQDAFLPSSVKSTDMMQS